MSRPIDFHSIHLPVTESALRGGLSFVTAWTCSFCGALVADVNAHSGYHAQREEP